MATRNPRHAAEESVVFAAFLKAHPTFSATVASWEQPDVEFPDVSVTLNDGRKIDFELGEWLHGEQMAKAKRRERLVEAIEEAIGPGHEHDTTEVGGGVLAPTPGSSFQFTGRENDGTGLHYYRARYYHPTNYRFASEDPLASASISHCRPEAPRMQSRGATVVSSNPLDLNRYAFVRNNPVLWVDPDGWQATPRGFECPTCYPAVGVCRLRGYQDIEWHFGPDDKGNPPPMICDERGCRPFPPTHKIRNCYYRCPRRSNIPEYEFVIPMDCTAMGPY